METYETRYGTVYHSPVCKDDWSNIVTKTVKRKGPGGWSATYKLQEPAIASLRAVAKELGGKFRQAPVRVTGTFRTCAYQHELWVSDPSRYANPNSTLHTQGLAIDVDTTILTDKIRLTLLAHGWHQSRPTDEPWHFSFRLTA